MARILLDTNVLIQYWRTCRRRSGRPWDDDAAVSWARQLVHLFATDAIATPVAVEFAAGLTTSHDLRLARRFLAQFRVVDQGIITPEDWRAARKLAERIPRDGKPRQLGDCLLRAIANRLRYKVFSHDKTFPT